jgi:hypothetical protein
MPSDSRAVVEIRPNAIPSAPSTSCARKPIPIRVKNSNVMRQLVSKAKDQDSWCPMIKHIHGDLSPVIL